MRTRVLILAAACLVAGVMAFGATGNNGFVYGKDVAHLSVRPLVLVSLAFETALLGPEPGHFHWTDLLLHLVAAGSLGYLVMRWAEMSATGQPGEIEGRVQGGPRASAAGSRSGSRSGSRAGSRAEANESRSERRARARAEESAARSRRRDRSSTSNAGVLLGGLVASLFALLHPLRGETVLHVLGRGEILATIFTAWAVLHFHAPGRRRWLVPVWSAAALASSPFALLLLPLAYVCGSSGRWRAVPWVASGLAVATVAIVVSAQRAGWPVPTVADNPVVGTGIFTRVSSAATTVWQYLYAWIWPVPVTPDRSVTAWNATPFASVPGVVATLGVVALGLVIARLSAPWLRARARGQRRADPLPRAWLLGMLWAAFGLLFASNLFWPTASGFSARSVYLPGAGLCILLGSLVATVLRDRSWRDHGPRVAAGVLAVACLAAVWSGAQRTPVWKSDRHLFEDVTRVQPEGYRGWYELGRAFFEEANAASDPEDGEGRHDSEGDGAPSDSTGRLDDALAPDQMLARAEAAWKRSVAILDGANPAWRGLTQLYYQEAQYDSAMWAADRVRNFAPEQRDAFLAFAEGLVSLGQLEAGLAEAERGLHFYPAEPRLHEIVARVRRRQEDTDGAIASYLEAARLDPQWRMPRERVGFMLMQEGRWEQAIHTYRELQALDPGSQNANALAWSLLEWVRTRSAGGQQLSMVERTRTLDEAIRLAQEAAETTFGDERKHVEDTLAQALWEAGRRDEAILVLQRVVRNYRDTAPYQERLDAYLAQHPLD